MLEVEGQLDGPAEDHEHDAQSIAGTEATETFSTAGPEGFYNSKKSSTWKKLKKMVGANTHSKPHGEAPATAAAGEGVPAAPQHHHTRTLSSSVGADFTSAASLCSQQQHAPADDAESEVASEMGRGSRMSMRYDLGSRAGDEDGGGSGKSTLKGMFKNKNKKSKQIELDALRFEMGMLQERADLTERDLATYRHDVGTLRAERDHMVNQVHELTVALTTTRSERDSAESERDRLKELHGQVKAALQESYSREQALMKQVKELEELCGAQQNSLEESEERYRGLQQEHDELHHTALAAKAQLVTAQAQLAEARNQREEMLADLASLTSQASALQAEIDSRDEKMGGLEAAAEQAHSGLEAALGRLRELEGEQQQLEARVTLLQEENLELSTELSGGAELRRQLEVQLGEATAANSALQAELDRANVNVDTLTARMAELSSQLANSSEMGGSLRVQNSELMSELSLLREQQQSKSKQGSPLSKWRKGSSSTTGGTSATGSKPAAGSSGSGTAAAPAVPAAAAGSSTAGEPSSFSPMTSQLPARASGAAPVSGSGAGAASQHWPEDGTHGQACPDAVVLAQEDSSVAAGAAAHLDAPGSPEPMAGATAAVTTSAGGDAAALKLAVGSGAGTAAAGMDMAKGPLTASRPTSRRQTGPGGGLQGQAAGMAAAERLSKVVARSPRKLFNAEEAPDMQQDMQQPQRQQHDLFSRLFTCLAPKTVEMQ
ncbi:hypothetical protein OEZ86_008863 [Tetradesmus obliquus]|nr:hypothetical protein OEZ86_008863 [Tetradesmus obliquus]